jgi:hypothetical protein
MTRQKPKSGMECFERSPSGVNLAASKTFEMLLDLHQIQHLWCNSNIIWCKITIKLQIDNGLSSALRDLAWRTNAVYERFVTSSARGSSFTNIHHCSMKPIPN